MESRAQATPSCYVTCSAHPSAVRSRAAAREIVKMPDILERYASLNLEPVSMSPEDFGEFIKRDLQKYAEIAKKARIDPQ